MRRALAAAIVGALALSAAASAEAAQRYASTAGGGEACTREAACSLKTAIAKAASGDEVIITAGTYAVKENLLPAAGVENLNIHGDFASPVPPTIHDSVIGPTFRLAPGGRISYVDLSNMVEESTGIDCDADGLVERVTVTIVGDYTVGILDTDNCTVRDSVIQVTGREAHALFSAGGKETAVATNVTAVAAGPNSTGLLSRYIASLTGTHPVALTNSVVDGGSADLETLEASGSSGTILASHSNFNLIDPESVRHVTDLGGNQTTAPLFVNPAAGDFHEAVGSPTIDAGTAVPESLDLDGSPRLLGTAPDIGAYEYVPAALEAGGVRSISIKPKRFGAWPSGGSVAPGILKSKPPKGAAVSYTMSGAGTVEFSVARRVAGHRVGKLCKRAGHRKTSHGRCFLYVPVQGSFTQEGATGANSFVFSGRIGGRALKAGSYKLSAYAGHLVSAGFQIGGLRHHRHRR